MLNTRHILPILFGMLLSLTACQKIDDSVFNNDKSTAEQESTSTSTSTQSNGAETNSDSQKPIEQQDGTLYLPADGHVIALKTQADAATTLLYISLSEWCNIAYSSTADVQTQAKDIAGRYQEGDIRGWRIPTKDEAKALKALYLCNADEQQYCDTLKTLNKVITALKGDPINAWEAKDKLPAYRYLCSEADSSFSFKSGTNIAKTGKTVKYNLRLVKDSTITNINN